jgi:predicted nucleic acid-binding protein
VVLDTSAAIEVALNRSKAPDFTHALQEADMVLAPELLVAEVVNTVWKYYQFERLSLPACDRVVELSLALVDVLVSCKELYREAFLLARTVRRSAYDMFYLALAQREDATFLTKDAALRNEAERQGIAVL